MVDWSQPAGSIARRLRAFDPFPGASGVLRGETLKLWSGEALAAAPVPQAAPGRIESVGPEGIDVRCGEGLLRLTQLQRAGGRRLPAADFLRGFEVKAGDVFAPRVA